MSKKAEVAPTGLEDLTDEELLIRYRDAKDRDAFSTLVHRYEHELFSYLRRYLGDAAQAEDVFQNTFLQVHLKVASYQEGRPVRPWLYTIATHQAIDMLRKVGRHQAVSLNSDQEVDNVDVGSLVNLLESSALGPPAVLQEKERGQWVRDSIQRLPEHLRSVVLMAYYQNLKYRDISSALGIPVGTVKSRLHAAIAKLHEYWKQAQAVGEN